MRIRRVFSAFSLFHDRGLYYTETSPMICRANRWTCFYMIGTFVTKGLITFLMYTNSCTAVETISVASKDLTTIFGTSL